MATWASIFGDMGPEERRRALAALLGAPDEEAPPVRLLDQRLVATPGDRLEREIPIPQWTGADGTLYGVRIQALTFRHRMEAEIAATMTDPRTGRAEIQPWRLMAEEVARGVLRPRVTVDHILDWSDDVVRQIYRAIHDAAPYPPAMVAAELARLAGANPPEPRGGAANAQPHQPLHRPGPPPGHAPIEPGGDEPGGSGDGDSGDAVG